jgi:hypothetical protein
VSNRLFFVMKWAYLRALAALAGLASGGLALLASVWLGATCDFRRSRRDGKGCAIISLQGASKPYVDALAHDRTEIVGAGQRPRRWLNWSRTVAVSGCLVSVR